MHSTHEHRSGHNLSHSMIGKKDRAGRLLTDSQKLELKKVKMSKAPNHPWWNEISQPLDEKLLDLIGVEEFDKFIDSHPDDITSMALHYSVKKRLEVAQEGFKNIDLDIIANYPKEIIAELAEKHGAHWMAVNRVLRLCDLVTPNTFENLDKWISDYLSVRDAHTGQEAANYANLCLHHPIITYEEGVRKMKPNYVLITVSAKVFEGFQDGTQTKEFGSAEASTTYPVAAIGGLNLNAIRDVVIGEAFDNAIDLGLVLMPDMPGGKPTGAGSQDNIKVNPDDLK